MAQNSYPIIVVGAGMAGISAAAHLRQHGKHALILEARPRLGGRIRTDRSLGFAIDMGASWIHGLDGNPLTDLANQFDAALTTLTEYGDIALYDIDGSRVNHWYQWLATKRYEKIERQIEEIQELSAKEDVSLATVLSELDYERFLPARLKRVLEYELFGELQNNINLRPEQIGLHAFGTDVELPGGDKIFLNGYDQLVNGLVKDVDVQLQQVVSSISLEPAQVTIETSEDIFHCKQCIVTLPLGVLKRGQVEFMPSLPKRLQRAITRLQFGHFYKIALRFPEVFWDPVKQFIGFIGERYGPHGSGAHLFGVNHAFFSGEPAITLMTGAKYAEKLYGMEQAAVVDEMMAHFRHAFGNLIPEPIASTVTDWTLSPFTQGSYSYYGIGSGRHDSEAFAEPVNRQLFFAGEHTHPLHIGTVHGAYLSGVMAAEKVLHLS